MMFDWEEMYYRSQSYPMDGDLEEIIELARAEFNLHPSPYTVRVYDNETGRCVFSLIK